MNVVVLMMKTCKAGVPTHQTSCPMKQLMAEVLKAVWHTLEVVFASVRAVIYWYSASFRSFPAVNRQGPVKRKSDSSDDQIFDEDEKSSEPQQKRVAPSPWITAKKEEDRKSVV
jgi:hypothetical protein